MPDQTTLEEKTQQAAAAAADSSAKVDSSQAPETDGKDSATEGVESLTPNLRRIRDSLKDDADFHALDPAAQRVVLKRLEVADKAFHKDRAQVTENQRVRDAIDGAGVTLDDIQQLIEAKHAGRSVSTTQVKEAVKETATELKGLNRLMSQAKDAESRELIRELQQSLREELETLVESHPRTKALQQELDALKQTTTSRRAHDAEGEIEALEKDYPSSLLEKYRSKMVQAASLPAFRHLSMEDILYRLATAKEIREARSVASPASKGSAEKTQTNVSTGPVADEKELEAYKSKKDKTWDLKSLTDNLVSRALAKVGTRS